MATKLTKSATALASARDALADDIADLRDQRFKLLERVDAVRAAPATESEIRARVVMVIDAAESEARTWISPEAFAGAVPGDPGLDAGWRNAPTGMLALLGGRDAMVDRLVALAVEAAPGKPVSTATREAELDRLAGEVWDVESAEENLLREAESAGLTVPRRADANPALYLAEEV